MECPYCKKKGCHIDHEDVGERYYYCDNKRCKDYLYLIGQRKIKKREVTDDEIYMR